MCAVIGCPSGPDCDEHPNAQPSRKRSGPSGANLQPRYTLRASQAEFDAWQAAADARGVPLGQWIREALNGPQQGWTSTFIPGAPAPETPKSPQASSASYLGRLPRGR